MPPRRPASPLRARVFLPSLGIALLGGCPSPPGAPLPSCGDPVASPGALKAALDGSGIAFVGRSRMGLDGLPPMIDQVLAGLAAGVVAADLDGDGHADLLFTQDDGPNALYWGHGDGTFSAGDAGEAAFPEARTFGASAADVDGDGDLDLLLSQFGGARLLRNRGDRTFEDVTETYGIPPNDGAGTTSAWTDLDGDGDLDLYAGFVFVDLADDAEPPQNPASWVPSTGRDAVLRNDGDRFVPIGALPTPRGNDGGVLHARWTDWDDDGDMDLIQANDGELTVNSFLWENQGLNDDGTWSPVDRLPDTDLGLISSPMGFSVADLDADGDRDLVISSKGPARALKGDGDWGFLDVGPTWNSGLPSWPSVSWSVVALDLDGDGDPGLLVTYGPLTDAFMAREPGDDASPEAPWRTQPDRFSAPVGPPAQRTFVDATSVFSEPSAGNGRGVGIADFDENGVPDVVIANLNGPPALYLGACTAAHRLVIALEDASTDNRFGIGARVTVTAGGRTRFSEVTAGGLGSFSGSGPDLFFGLGDADVVDAVEVRWPGGETRTYTEVCVDCRLVLSRQ